MKKNREEHQKSEKVFPTSTQIETEIARIKYKKVYGKVLRSTIYSLITVAAIAVLIATVWMPVLQVYGSSMTPTLENDNIVVTFKTSDLEQGDIIAFYFNNKILIKRIIAEPGDIVDIREDGTVYVNEEMLDEPYIAEKALGECNVEFPFEVPQARWFVIGDNREASVDSRNTAVGCVAEEQIVGRVIFRIWPWERIGIIR